MTIPRISQVSLSFFGAAAGQDLETEASRWRWVHTPHEKTQKEDDRAANAEGVRRKSRRILLARTERRKEEKRLFQCTNAFNQPFKLSEA